VVELVAAKRYANVPQLAITITPLPGLPAQPANPAALDHIAEQPP
jgi:hypothetical protein